MKKIKFEQAIEEYLQFVKLKKKMDTYSTVERRIKKHIQPFFNNKYIDEISPFDIIKWQLEVEKLGFKYNYKSSLYYALSNFYLFCSNFYNVENVVKKVGNFKNDEIKQKGNIWTYDEFKQFIDSIDNKKYHLLFNLLYFTGMRKGELLALKWQDIDFKNKIISINKTITRSHEIQTPKTKTSNRTIMIDDLLLDELYNYSLNKDNDDIIFNISFTQLLRMKNYYCNKANVKQIKIHEFRHSHACLLYTHNVPIDQISNRLGHSKISITTDTYLKYLPKNEKRVIATLNSLRFN